MVRRIARSPATEVVGLPQSFAGRECGSCSGADAPGMVVSGRANHRSFTRRAQLGQRNPYEPARSCRRELALALPRRHAVLQGCSMAAGIDGKLKALEQSEISEPAGSSLTLTQRDAPRSRS